MCSLFNVPVFSCDLPALVSHSGLEEKNLAGIILNLCSRSKYEGVMWIQLAEDSNQWEFCVLNSGFYN